MAIKMKMLQCASHISLILLVMSLYCLCKSASSSTSQNDYPLECLACKTYNVTKIDCSNRNLLEIPVLNQNITTTLDLSRNHLININGAPFEELHVLLILNLSYSEISWMSTTSLNGLHLLKYLNLQGNKLVDLPKYIFSDLLDLIQLLLDFNYFTAIPDQVLIPLQSLRYFSFLNLDNDVHEIDVSSFQNLTNLNILQLGVRFVTTNISSKTFLPLHNLPLRTLWWWWAESTYSVSKDVFEPLSSISTLTIKFGLLPAITSLQSPLQSLGVFPDSSRHVFVLGKSSLQVLQKWNTSLESLILYLVSLKRIENYTFVWTPNLHVLDLSKNQINYLAERAFYGLSSLERLTLSDNILTYLPVDALEIFRKTSSLQYLDLGSNPIYQIIGPGAFFNISAALRYLNLEINYRAYIFSLDVIGALQGLEHLTVTSRNYFYSIGITIRKPLPSLYTFQVKNIRKVKIVTPLYILFPSLKVLSISFYAEANVKFQLLEAVQGFSNLKELDLSGILQCINLVDFNHLNITLSNLETFKLAYNKLTSVKLIFFINTPKLKNLDLAENLLTTVDSEIAHKYPCLVSLSLQDNELTSLSGLENLALLLNLNAAGNKITAAPNWVLYRKRYLKTLNLNENPFQCTCGIEQFRNWIISNKQTWLQPGQYICASPENFQGMSITTIELDCRPNTAFYLSIIIPSVVLFCTFLVILFRYRWHIKYKLFLIYRNYHPFPDPDEDFEMLRLQYHAYVAYNENSAVDDAWVMNDLQPNMEEGPEPVKLCIKSRDFTPGRFLLDSINESIRHSRKTILVLSPKFVESEWCYQEMQMAQLRLLDDNCDVLVLVLLNDIPERKMTLSLRQILCRKDYLKWPNDRAGQRLFWQRLKEEVKGPVHVNRCFQL